MATLISELEVPRMMNAVRALRRERGWRREDLAARSGVSYSQIVQIEKADNPHEPNARTMLKLAAAFGLPLHRVFWPSDESAA